MLSILYDFICFSIIGYIAEIFHCGIRGYKSGKALRGPWCPLYGLGGILIILALKPFRNNIILIYLVGVVIATITEYYVSLVLEKIFKTRWWDYSNVKYNLNGRICLRNSLLFGILSIVLYYIYLPLKGILLEKIDIITINAITLAIAIIMLIDGVFTVLDALELKKRIDLVDKIGIKNKDKIHKKLSKLKETYDYKRLLKNYDFRDKRTKFLKKYYKLKSHFINK